MYQHLLGNSQHLKNSKLDFSAKFQTNFQIFPQVRLKYVRIDAELWYLSKVKEILGPKRSFLEIFRLGSNMRQLLLIELLGNR